MDKVLNDIYEKLKEKTHQQKLELLLLNDYVFDKELLKKLFNIDDSLCEELIYKLYIGNAIFSISSKQYDIVLKGNFVNLTSNMIFKCYKKENKQINEDEIINALTDVAKKNEYDNSLFIEKFGLDFFDAVDIDRNLFKLEIIKKRDNLIYQIDNKFLFYKIVKKILKIKDENPIEKNLKNNSSFYEFEDNVLFDMLKKHLVYDGVFLKRFDAVFKSEIFNLKTATKRFDKLVSFYTADEPGKYLFKYFISSYLTKCLRHTFNGFLEVNNLENNKLLCDKFEEKIKRINDEFAD